MSGRISTERFSSTLTKSLCFFISWKAFLMPMLGRLGRKSQPAITHV